MEQRGGAMAAKRAKPSAAAAGEDRLSSLPDEVLVLILLRLGTAAAAGRTSVLSRRWRRVWALLPELRFRAASSPHAIASALAAHEAEAALSHLLVEAEDAAPGSVAAWLPAAARRLSGTLVLRNRAAGANRVDGVEEEEEAASQGGAVELPRFQCATSVLLDLGFLALAVPPAGVFGRLTQLSLRRVRFHGSCELGAISSPRFPCLQKLVVSRACGLENLAIHSESLLRAELFHLDRLQQLNIVAPALQRLIVCGCFVGNYQPVANISTPQLQCLSWNEPYDPSSVKLGDLGQVRHLSTIYYLVYGRQDSRTNRAFLLFLERFPEIRSLQTKLVYPMDIGNSQYSMQCLTVLPQIKSLTLILSNKGHNFGASLFHILSLCTCLGVLRLALQEAQSHSACPSGCTCDEPTNWKTEELILKRLREVEISDMEGSDHELNFMKRLFCWAVKLKKLRVTYHSVTVSKAKKAHEKLDCLQPTAVIELFIDFVTPCSVFAVPCRPINQ